jgi:hypothetical protein
MRDKIATLLTNREIAAMLAATTQPVPENKLREQLNWGCIIGDSQFNAPLFSIYMCRIFHEGVRPIAELIFFTISGCGETASRARHAGRMLTFAWKTFSGSYLVLSCCRRL